MVVLRRDKRLVRQIKEYAPLIYNGEGYPMKVTLGMWRNKEGLPFLLNLGRDGFRG